MLNSGPASTLGQRLRTLRRGQQRTLRDVAGRCGYTVSLLSKIESGKVSPPVATLAKIAGALGVELSELLSESREGATVFVPAAETEKTPPTPADKGYGFHLIAGARRGKVMQPFIFVAERGKVKPGPLSHPGEEFVYVLSGRMNFRVGSRVYMMGPGDGLYFSSLEEHDLEPVSARVKYLAVFAPADAPRAAGKRGGRS